MIEVMYEEVSNQMFMNAMEKLARSPMQVKAAYQVKKMIDEINKMKRKITAEFQKEVADKFVKKDEQGKILFNEDGQYTILEGKAEEYMKETEAFGKRIAVIDREKLPFHWIANANGLSAIDVQAILPIVDEEAQLPGNVGNVVGLTPPAARA